MDMLKAYQVHDGFPEENAVLVYAYTEGGAKVMAVSNSSVFDDPDELIAERLPEADTHVLENAKLPYVETSDHVLRMLGWHDEGDRRCATCGLAEMGGAFPVCDECYQCNECGHHDECSRNPYPISKFCCGGLIMNVYATGDSFIIRECPRCRRQATERL